MVVLSVGMNPPADAAGPRPRCSASSSTRYGFCKTNPLNPIETSRPGIFISGAFQGPIDIPESVVTASGAGALCGQLLDYRRGKLAKERVYPAGTGRLGRGAQGRASSSAIAARTSAGSSMCLPSSTTASTLDNVVHAEEGLFICSTDAAAADREHDPREGAQPRGRRGLHAEDARAAVPGHAAGRRHQPVLLRHGQHPRALLLGALPGEGATPPQKAKDIVRMSVARTSPSGAAAGIRSAGQQDGAGGRRRRGRDDQRAQHGRAGIRGLPGGEGVRPGRHGAQTPLHAGRAGRPGVPARPRAQGLPASR